MELRKVKVTAAVLQEAAKPDYKIPDAVRPQVIERVTARLGSQEIPDAKLSETVAEGVRSEVAFGQGLRWLPMWWPAERWRGYARADHA